MLMKIGIIICVPKLGKVEGMNRELTLNILFGFYREVILDGFVIPKNTQVIPSLYSVSMDEELWEDPEEFNPTRFLNEDGAVVKPDFWMPFGAGRRMCLGDTLAKQELYLFFTSLVHCFHLKQVEGAVLPDLVGQAAVTICPGEYEVRINLTMHYLLQLLVSLDF